MKRLIGIILLLIYMRGLAQNRNDIVIDEIMSDPTPVAGLPPAEWIELRNTTAAAVNLAGWKLGDASGLSGSLPSFVLRADSCVAICSAASVPALSVFGAAISVTSFPSLDNNGEMLYLQSANGRYIHAVNYDISWFGNLLKSDGGWSLEMVDIKNPCTGSHNWGASIDPKGGTPGRVNSINGSNPDRLPPKANFCFAPDPTHLLITMDEPVDSNAATVPGHYQFSDGLGLPVAATALPPGFNKISLAMAVALQINKIYTVTIAGLNDCAGNISPPVSCRLGLAVPADSGDLVINEVLFNPRPNGYDYVEIFNRGKKIIDMKSILVTNNSAGAIKNFSDESRLFFPGEYALCTESARALTEQYTIKDSGVICEIHGLPSYPDDKGSVVLLNGSGKLVDQLDYDAHWHFPLIDNPEGIALERIDPFGLTGSPANWTSAAATAGFGTPGYLNSQYRSDLQPKAAVSIVPSIFSPDNDGFEDFTWVKLNCEEPGYLVNIRVFDAAGNQVRNLQKNTTCGLTANFRWDGLNDLQLKVPIGIYLVYTDIFNLKGKRKIWKNTVVVARKF